MTKDEVRHIAEWAQNLVNAYERRDENAQHATLNERTAIDQLYILIRPHVTGYVQRLVA
jgi:hypothetical protein